MLLCTSCYEESERRELNFCLLIYMEEKVSETSIRVLNEGKLPTKTIMWFSMCKNFCDFMHFLALHSIILNNIVFLNSMKIFAQDNFLIKRLINFYEHLIHLYLLHYSYDRTDQN